MPISTELPPNCELERIDDDSWRLIFWGTDPFYSEEFHVSEKESVRSVALEYCERFGWLEAWPNKSDDIPSLLDELEQLATDAVSLIERNPEAFSTSFDTMFDDGAPEGPFKWDGAECDPEFIPSGDDDSWTEYDRDITMQRFEDGTRRITFYETDTSGNRECNGEYEADDDEYRYQSATQGCTYNCLKIALYDLYCARTGEDPLGNVYPQDEVLDGTYRLTASATGVTAEHVSGHDDERLRTAAIDYIGGDRRTWDDLQDVLTEGKSGETDPEKDFDLYRSWTSWNVDTRSDTAIVVSVHMKRKLPVVDQATHVREVGFRGLEANIRSLYQDVTKAIGEQTDGQ